ncbi:hypothetical protein GE21DRAFT_1211265, partial [Neurospora crassa]
LWIEILFLPCCWASIEYKQNAPKKVLKHVVLLGGEIETGENPDGPLIIARNLIRCIKSKVAPRRPDFSA